MNLKFIASGAVCAGVGAVAAWAITADYAERKSYRLVEAYTNLTNDFREKSREAARLDLELTEVKDELDKLEHKLVTITGGSDFHEEEPDEIVSGGEVDVIPPGETVEQTREKLQEFIDTYTGGPEEGVALGEMTTKVVESTKYDPPFVISNQLYASLDDEEGNEYEKATLTYYEKDRVLLDEEMDPIDQSEIERMVGWRNLNRFGDESGSPDVVFVRCRRLETDFEIERETEEDLPLHVKWGMPKDEFETRRSAGLIKFREGDV